MRFRHFSVILPLLWCAGCCWMLPPGDPPPDAIVDIHPPAERDRRGAENDAVTSLAGYTLQNCPGAAISVQAPEPMASIARRIIGRTGEISGIRYHPESGLILRGFESAGRWRFQLYDSARKSIVWQEIFVLKP